MKKEKFIASFFAAVLSLSSSLLPLSANGADISTTSAPITFSDADGKSEDDDFSMGDVNGDGAITPIDASLTLYEYSLLATTGKGAFTEAETKRADVDHNNLIDTSDASYILSYYAYIATGGELSMEDFMKNPFHPPLTTTTTTATTTATTKTTAATTKSTATTTKTTGTTTKTTATTKSTATTTKTTATTTKSTATTTKTTATTTKSTTTTTKTTATTTKSTATTTKTTATTTKSTTTTTKPTSTTTTTTASTAATTTTTSYVDPNKVSSIQLTRTEMEISVGDGALSAYVTMLPSTALNKAEKWTSSDESIAVVDSEGWVIGKKEGTCIITVTSVDNPEVSAKITVKVVDNSHVKKITLSRDSMTIKVGQGELSAYVTMLPESAWNKGEIWSSSDESIAVVDSEGWVVGKKAGDCTITVKSADNPDISATIKVTVTGDDSNSTTTTSTTTSNTTTASTNQSTTTTSTTTTTTTGAVRVTEIKLSKTEITVPIGGKDLSWVTMLPADAPNKDEIWVSSDESIATVDKYGWICGVAVGQCTVTVISANNPDVNAKIAVTVVESMVDPPKPDVLFSSIAPNQPDADYVAFKTPLPENISGRFIIDYIITDENGVESSITSPVIVLPYMESVITNLKAATNKFTVTAYLTNLETYESVELGKYSFVTSPRDAKTQTENIQNAFNSVS